MSTPNEVDEGQYRQVLHNLIMGALGSEVNTKIVHKDKRDIMKHMGGMVNAGTKRGQVDSKLSFPGNKSGKRGKCGTKCRSTERDVVTTTSDEDTDGSARSRRKTGKLTSGKLVKVNDLYIKVQVRYPHSRLNGEFTTVWEFDRLPLNLLAAGEIELILRSDTVEGRDRLQVLLVMLYYSKFLEVGELQYQYDVLMKQLERCELNWGDPLADKMEQALDCRLQLRDQ